MKLAPEKLEKAKEKSAKFWLTITRTRPMWGLIPLRIVFGVTLLLEGVSRFTFVRENKLAILDQLPSAWSFSFVVLFSVVEIIAGMLALPGFMTRFVGFAILIETVMTIGIEKIPLAAHQDLQTQALLIAVAALLTVSGPGRYSVDGVIAKKILKKRPVKKWEIYCYAETPYTKWWE